MRDLPPAARRRRLCLLSRRGGRQGFRPAPAQHRGSVASSAPLLLLRLPPLLPCLLVSLPAALPVSPGCLLLRSGLRA